MLFLSSTASLILAHLTEGLADPCASDAPSSRRYEPSGAPDMVVERIGRRSFSVGTYFIQNGDRMSHPEMTFYRSPAGEWAPLHHEMHAGGLYEVAAEVCPVTGRIDSVSWPKQAELAAFAEEWLRDLVDQQALHIPGVM